MLVIVGTPLVARALDDDVAPNALRPPVSSRVFDATIDADPATADALMSLEPSTAVPAPVPAPAPAPTVTPAPDAVVDPVMALLADTYTWDERGPRVVVLQEALGVAADGWYAQATQQAHRLALDFVGLPTDIAPAPVLPPGPDASKWAALRDCESNGNYAITNPSGKYRGAYQFDRRTWNSVAERHAPRLVGVDPAAASPADQDLMALALYSERGASPWPQCGRHLS